jgi:hypothetical protein
MASSVEGVYALDSADCFEPDAGDVIAHHVERGVG